VLADRVSVDFGTQHALDEISFAVPAGTIVGLIGPSGCGKTTLVRALTGILAPTEGTVRVFGDDPRTFSTRQRTRFGYMPQLPTLFPNLSVWANLNFVASLYGMPIVGRRTRLGRLLGWSISRASFQKLADAPVGCSDDCHAATLVHERAVVLGRAGSRGRSHSA
jgi:ABC-2 type transport system ATP-binding protein